MKQFVFITSFTFALSFSVFAQNENATCPQIKINAPEYINEREENFKVSASFENEKSISASKFNWIIVKDNKVEKKNDEEIIEIGTSDTDKQNRIAIVAENPDARCKNPAFVSVIVVPNIGSPLIFDQYSDSTWNDEKARLDLINVQMKERKDQELLIWINLDKKSFNSKSKSKLLKILNHLSTRGLAKNRVTFMISEAEENSFKYQPIPNELLTYYYDESIMIRGEDLEKLSSLF